MRSLRSSQQQAAFDKFIETFDRFETAYVRSQQPEVRSRYKKLLFESQVDRSLLDRSMASLLDSGKQSPARPRTIRSARVSTSRGHSVDNILSITMS